MWGRPRGCSGPALSFLSSGTRNFPVIAETAKLSMQAMMIFMFVFLRRVGGVLPLYLREPLAHDLPLVEVVFYRSDLLIGLVPLAAEDDDVARFRLAQSKADGLAPVLDDGERRSALQNGGEHIS